MENETVESFAQYRLTRAKETLKTAEAILYTNLLMKKLKNKLKLQKN